MGPTIRCRKCQDVISLEPGAKSVFCRCKIVSVTSIVEGGFQVHYPSDPGSQWFEVVNAPMSEPKVRQSTLIGYLDKMRAESGSPTVVSDTGEISRIAMALRNPLRILILHHLSQEPASCIRLARRFELPSANILYHIRKLEELGLIEVVSTTITPNSISEKFYAPTLWGMDFIRTKYALQI